MKPNSGFLGVLAWIARIANQNPATVHTVARLEYQHRLGIPWDRRHRLGYSAPPQSLHLHS